jgi:hypothetical protein
MATELNRVGIEQKMKVATEVNQLGANIVSERDQALMDGKPFDLSKEERAKRSCQ